MTDKNARTDGLSPVKRALYEVSRLRAELERTKQAAHEPIAVIGMGCRFPGADSPDAFWRLLLDGVDAITEIPRDRFDIDRYYNPDPTVPGAITTRWGGFIDGIDAFAADFFNISPREAENIDPQQRLLLEVSWEALEHAAQAPDRLRGSDTGVFVGMSTFDYWHLNMSRTDPRDYDAYLGTGGAHSVAAGRLSYLLGLEGPCMAVDTACSSSLTAILAAVRNLRNHDCSMAIAGGVNVILSPAMTISLSKARLMAADGRCKTFDHRADGFVRSEGCGMVVLKRYRDALAAGDRIDAVIRGGAWNQDGRSTSLTAPNGPSQERVIRAALDDAGVVPSQVSYIETHGTGTKLGDPIEAGALDAVFGGDRERTGSLSLGSVKTNIGHLEAAAGVAGFIKTVLCLKHGVIPRNLHFEALNPAMESLEMDFQVPVATTDWRNDASRVAGISSFGFGGSNVHLVLENAAEQTLDSTTGYRTHELLTLSARDADTIPAMAAAYETYLDNHPDVLLTDICHAANDGRARFEYRRAIPAESLENLRGPLSQLREGSDAPGILIGVGTDPTPPEVVFLFTGQGSQYPGMVSAHYESEPVFRRIIDQCTDILRPHLELPLTEVLFPTDASSGAIHETVYTQPALFVVEYAMAQLWKHWGVIPTAVLGHSIGEFPAACVAGVYSLEDGLKLIAERGRLMQELPRNGRMAVISAPTDEVATLIAAEADMVTIAVENSPVNTVISGLAEQVDAVCASAVAKGLRTHVLTVSHAFHSPLVDPVLEPLEAVAKTVTMQPPELEFISTVTGDVLAPDGVNAAYWRTHARQPVRFRQAISSLERLGCRIGLEVGPDAVLTSLAKRCLPESGVTWLHSARRSEPNGKTIMQALGDLYVQGVEVAWSEVYRDHSSHKPALPTYPFKRRRYWLPSMNIVDDRCWETVNAVARAQAGRCPIRLKPSTYPAKEAVFAELTTGYILRALHEFGLFTAANDVCTVAEAVSRAGIGETYVLLVERWFDRLASEEYLTVDNGCYRCDKPLPCPEAAKLRKTAVEGLADLPVLVEYIVDCGEKLAPVLRGEVNPLATLFPDGSFHIADFIYREWDLVRYFTDIAARIIETIGTETHEPLRIIEVGAGSGGMTSALLPVLGSHAGVYWFTDMSSHFINHAREQFATYPFVSYGMLDIGEDPVGQGFGSGYFDVVVAANVLHATEDITRTLEHVTTLLAPGGWLMLFEVTEPFSWFDVTVNIIEGLRIFNDDYRDTHAFIKPSVWREALVANGFDRIAVFPEDGSPAEALHHHLIIARRPVADGHGDRAVAPDAVSDATDATQPSAAVDADDFMVSLREVLPVRRIELLVDRVTACLMEVLRMDPAEPPQQNARLMELGVDSLVAVDFTRRLEEALSGEVHLPATLIFDYPTIEAIAGYLLDRLGLGGDVSEQTAAPDTSRMTAEDIAGMSDDEVSAMLQAKLHNSKDRS